MSLLDKFMGNATEMNIKELENELREILTENKRGVIWPRIRQLF